MWTPLVSTLASQWTAVQCSATVTVTKESIHWRTGWFRDGRSGHFRVCSAHVLLMETDPNRLQSLQVEVRKVGGPLSPPETLIPSDKRFPYWAADTVLCVYLHIMRLNAGQTAGIRCQSQEVMEITLQSETNMANRSWGFREPGGQGSGRAHSHALSETWDSHVLPREIPKDVWIYFLMKMTTFEQF